MKKISIQALILLTLFVSCERNEMSENSDEKIINNYDEQYFKGNINSTFFSLDDESNYFSSSRINWIDDNSNSDSVVLNYGFNCGDSSFTLRIDFFIKEAVKHVDTLDSDYSYRNLSVLKNLFNESSWTYVQDSVMLGRAGHIINNSKEINKAVHIKYSNSSNIWQSGLINNRMDISAFSFYVSNSYIKPVIVNYWEDNTGNDIDSVLYIEGEFNCTLLNHKKDSIIEIREAVFRANIDIDPNNDL